MNYQQSCLYFGLQNTLKQPHNRSLHQVTLIVTTGKISRFYNKYYFLRARSGRIHLKKVFHVQILWPRNGKITPNRSVLEVLGLDNPVTNSDFIVD